MIYFLRHCEKEKGYFYDENKKILDDPLSAEGSCIRSVSRNASGT